MPPDVPEPDQHQPELHYPLKLHQLKLGLNLFYLKHPLIAVAPNCEAVTVDKLPIKLPIGVRTAETITTFLFMILCC